MLGNLSPKLKARLFYPLLVAGALLVPGSLVVSAFILNHFFQEDWMQNGLWARPAYLVFIALFLWLLMALLLAQHLRLKKELRDLDGEYYEYQGQPIRVVFDEADELWLSAADLAATLGRGPRDLRRMLLGMGPEELCHFGSHPLLSKAGVARLFARRSGRDVALLERYLLKEVYPTHEKRRAMGALHYQSRLVVQALREPNH